MSINLLDLMQGAIGDKVVGQVAGVLGVDQASVTKMVGGALPTLLAGFIGKASTDEGAEQLGAVLDQADGSILDNIGEILGGADGGSDRLLEMGKGLLGGLFGEKIEGILDLLSGISGLDKEKSGSLLALITPVIFSLLGKQKKGLGLDGAGFAKLLFSQKDLLKSALPPGFAGVLGLSGFEGDTDVSAAAVNLKDAVVNAASEKVGEAKDAGSSMTDAAVEAVEDKVDGGKEMASSALGTVEEKAGEAKDAAVAAVSSAADKVDEIKEKAATALDVGAVAVEDKAGEVKAATSRSVEAVSSAAEKTTEAAVKSGGFMKILISLIVLTIIGFCVLKFVVPMLSGAPKVSIPAVNEISTGNALSTIEGVINNSKSTLGSIKDVESAMAAVPEIEGITKSLGAVGRLRGSLPDGVKEQIKNAIVSFAPKFKELVDKAYSIPGVQAIIEPKINDLVNQLEGFAG